MEVGEVPKGIRWLAKAGGPPKVRIGGVSDRGRGPTVWGAAGVHKELRRQWVNGVRHTF